jgi:hypothetical protein
MEGVSEVGASLESLDVVAAPVGEFDGSSGCADGVWQVAESEVKTAEIGEASGRIRPMLHVRSVCGSFSHRLDRLSQPTKPTEGGSSLVHYPGSINQREGRNWLASRYLEEVCDQG